MSLNVNKRQAIQCARDSENDRVLGLCDEVETSQRGAGHRRRGRRARPMAAAEQELGQGWGTVLTASPPICPRKSHLLQRRCPVTPGSKTCRDRPDRPSPARPLPCPHPRNVLATRTLSGDQVEAVRGLSQAVACIPRAGVHVRALQRIPIPALGNRPDGSPSWCPWSHSSLDWWGDPGPELP